MPPVLQLEYHDAMRILLLTHKTKITTSFKIFFSSVSVQGVYLQEQYALYACHTADVHLVCACALFLNTGSCLCEYLGYTSTVE